VGGVAPDQFAAAGGDVQEGADRIGPALIVPASRRRIVRVGMQPGTLCVPFKRGNAERPWRYSHAEHGNDQKYVSGRLASSRAGSRLHLERIPLWERACSR
jgi:hypothetical protein